MNRWYSSAVGRFTTPDPYSATAEAVNNPADPGSWNRYAYVLGDPINFYDRVGLNAAAPKFDCDYDSEGEIAGCGWYYDYDGGVGGGGGPSTTPPEPDAKPTREKLIKDCIDGRYAELDKQSAEYWRHLNDNNGGKMLWAIAWGAGGGLVSGGPLGAGMGALGAMAVTPWRVLVQNVVAFQIYFSNVIVSSRDRAVMDCGAKYGGPPIVVAPTVGGN